MICKLQRSLNLNGDRMLVYSEDRRAVWFEGTLAADVAEMMGADRKCFVEVRLVAGRGFVIERRLDRAAWPSW